MDYGNAHPANKTQPGNYPRPKCDPKKTIIHTTPAAHKPTMGPDPSVVYRGSRPHRPQPPLSNGPRQSPYPPQAQTPKQSKPQTRPNSTPSDTDAACPFIPQPQLRKSPPRPTSSTPPARARPSRYPQHPLSQVGSVCSPAARMANPHAFGVHRAAHTNH